MDPRFRFATSAQRALHVKLACRAVTAGRIRGSNLPHVGFRQCDKRMLGARYDPERALSDPRFAHSAGLLLPILQVQRIEFVDAAIPHYQDAVVRSQSKPFTAEDGNRYIDVGEIWRSFCRTVRYSESP